MFKFVAVFALLACAFAQHHGHSHVESHGHGHVENHGHGHVESHGHGHVESHGHGHVESHGDGHPESHGNSEDAHAEVKHFDSDVHENGFHYGFETTNHIKAFSEGDEHGNHHGDFEWVSPEGEHINIKYVADENGYQPQSDVLPTPHPIPEAILKALKYIEEHPHDEVPLHGGRRY